MRHGALLVCGSFLGATLLGGCFGPTLPTIACSEDNLSCPPDTFCVVEVGECRSSLRGGDSDGGANDGATDGSIPTELVDEGLTARYFIDEAASGSGPGELKDSTTPNTPIPLGQSSDVEFVTDAGNRALDWRGIGFNEVSLNIEGTEFAAMDGTSRLTIELVVNLRQSSPNRPPLISLGRGAIFQSDDLGLRVRDQSIDVHFNDTRVANFPFDEFGKRVVIHCVIDSNQLMDENRVRFYVDGEEKTSNDGQGLNNNTSLILNPNGRLRLGARDSSSISGTIGYVAIYGDALDEASVDQNTQRLLASDDNLIGGDTPSNRR